MVRLNTNVIYFDASLEKFCVVFEHEKTYLVESFEELISVTGLPLPTSHNQAEYLGLIGALLSVENPERKTIVRGDSQLVIRQMRGEYSVKSSALLPYYAYVLSLLQLFSNIDFEFIPREENIAGRILEGKIPLGFKQIVQDKEEEELMCPILSIGRESLDYCLENCAFYLPNVDKCAIRVIAEKLGGEIIG